MSRVAQGVQQHFAGFVQRAVGVVEEVEEGAQACVDGLIAGFDQAVGVENELVTRHEVEAGGVEGDAAAAQRCAGRHVEKRARAVRVEEDRRQVAGEETWQCAVQGSYTA